MIYERLHDFADDLVRDHHYMEDGEAKINWEKIPDNDKKLFAKLFLEMDDFDMTEIMDIPVKTVLINLLMTLSTDDKIWFSDKLIDRIVSFYEKKMRALCESSLYRITLAESQSETCAQTGETTWR